MSRSVVSAAMMGLLLLASASGLASEHNGAIRFAVLGDRTNTANDSVYGIAISEIERLKPDLVMTVGDQIEGYTQDSTRIVREWTEYLKLVQPFSMPIHFTPGNHDITTDYMRPFYRRFAGEPYYSFDYGGRHFVVLDNTAGAGGPAAPIDDDQFDWLKQDLAGQTGETQILVFYHKPNWYETAALGKPDRMHELFVEYRVDAVFTGHYHAYFSSIIDGIKYTSVGSSGGSMAPGPTGIGYHFCWVTVSDEVYVTPIELGAGRSWADVTAGEYRTASLISIEAIQPDNWLEWQDNGKVSGRVAMKITNPSRSEAFADTVRWTGLEDTDWQMQPAAVSVIVPPGGDTVVEFTATAGERCYPLPELTATFQFKPDMEATGSRSFRVVRQAHCTRTPMTPVLDGKLEDACWKSPASRLLAPDNGPATLDPTEFYFAWDEANLFVAARCTDAQPEAIRAEIEERDAAVYSEDCVGFLFHPGNDTVTHIYVNPIGTLYDQKITFKEDGYYSRNADFDGAYEKAISKNADGWSIEMRIPFDQIGPAPSPGTIWDVTFRRKQHRLDTSGDWMPYDYYPDGFGLLVFE